MLLRAKLKYWLGLEKFTFERSLHLAIFVLLPALLLLEYVTLDDEVDLYPFVRIGIAVLAFLIYFGSFKLKFIRQDFVYINYIMLYLMVSHFIFLTYINQFPFYYSSLLIGVVLAASLFFRSRKQLLIFQASMLLLVVQATVLSASQEVDYRLFFVLYLFMNFCAYVIQDFIFRQRDKLEQAAEKLKRSNQSLEQFAYVASHDLQEPLRTVTSYVQLLERRYGDKLGKDAKEFIFFTVDATRRMQSLIQALLKFSRVSSENLDYQDLDLNEVMSNVNENLELAILESKTVINYPKLPVIAGDRIMITQLFQNLISNAIKYSKEEVPPIINVDFNNGDANWHFSVSDNGMGIAKKYHERVFQIFNRVSADHGIKGTGIGLAVCKRIVLNHGGELWLESEEGEGTTFHFTLGREAFN